jgi:geranylgeranyl diphosphate synthase type II
VQGMVGGQYMDVAGEAAVDDDLRTLHALKTGRLIQAAVVCGALLSGAVDVEPYRAFAAELGLLFQIVDDILDETGAAEELGKSVGKDRALDKVTYVSRFGMERASQLADEARDRARVLLDELPGDTADLAAVARFIHDRRR